MKNKAKIAFAVNGALTESVLIEFLRTEGKSLSATEGSSLPVFARWLLNTTIAKFAGRVDITNAEILKALNEVRIPGAPREVIKSWLAVRLFERTSEESLDDKLGNFKAKVKSVVDMNAAKQLMVEDEKEFGVYANRALLEAAEYFAKGDVHDAYVKFDEMRGALRAGEFTGHHTQGVFSIRPLDELAEAVAEAQHRRSPREPIHFVSQQHFSERKPIVVIGVDSVYHDRYASRMVQSSNGVVNLHFHICNPGNTTLIVADNVGYSFEDNAAAAAPYYATMRFLVLRQILEAYDAPVMTLDADSVLTGELPGLFGLMDRLDVALKTSQDSRGVLPWRYTNAQVVAASPTASAFEFFRKFEAQYDYLMEQDGAASWYVDQALLASTLFLTQESNLDSRLLMRGLSKLSGCKQSKL
ncbi:MAG: hypothetical protein H7317_10950 [Pseudorhodobacter sp.]|nr:hypothetical protein [Pseudorhodobacter sp.]